MESQEKYPRDSGSWRIFLQIEAIMGQALVTSLTT